MPPSRQWVGRCDYYCRLYAAVWRGWWVDTLNIEEAGELEPCLCLAFLPAGRAPRGGAGVQIIPTDLFAQTGGA